MSKAVSAALSEGMSDTPVYNQNTSTKTGLKIFPSSPCCILVIRTFTMLERESYDHVGVFISRQHDLLGVQQPSSGLGVVQQYEVKLGRELYPHV